MKHTRRDDTNEIIAREKIFPRTLWTSFRVEFYDFFRQNVIKFIALLQLYLVPLRIINSIVYLQVLITIRFIITIRFCCVKLT